MSLELEKDKIPDTGSSGDPVARIMCHKLGLSDPSNLRSVGDNRF